MTHSPNSHHYFKRGYVEALCNAISISAMDYGEHALQHGQLIELLGGSFRGKGWSWHELIDAGVPEQQLIALEFYSKAFGLGPRPIPPLGDQID
jgi:hypothetical protein